MILIFNSVDETPSVFLTFQMKAIEQYIYVVLFITLDKVAQILKTLVIVFNYSKDRYHAVRSHGVISFSLAIIFPPQKLTRHSWYNCKETKKKKLTSFAKSLQILEDCTSDSLVPALFCPVVS